MLLENAESIQTPGNVKQKKDIEFLTTQPIINKLFPNLLYGWNLQPNKYWNE